MTSWAGPPLASTLRFLLIPVGLAVLVEALGVGIPSWGLKVFALLYGMTLLVRTAQDPEWLLGIAILYLPLSRLYPALIAPGVNGANAVVLLMLLALLLRSAGDRQQPAKSMPAARLVAVWMALSCLSIIHTGFVIGFGVLVDNFSIIKGWLDQFLVFFCFLYLIRDGAMARRLLVYMMLGTAVVLGLGVLEWLDKRTLSTIERARLIGPQFQPNGFAAFLVIGVVPFIALFVSNLSRWWVWSIVPCLVMFVRVLLATFSRGAYIGFGLACVAISYLRGKVFLTSVIAACVGVFALAPDLIPESLVDRLEQSTGGGGGFAEDLDSSSRTRIVLWNAAIAMTAESPLFGKGFGMFPLLKDRYTEHPVAEGDNHNMFLYICSQMGIPALLVFLLIFYRMLILGIRLHRESPDRFVRGIGMTAVATVSGTVGLNMFGSRMVDISVMMHFWVLLSVVSHLWVEQVELARGASRERPAEGRLLTGRSRAPRPTERPLQTRGVLRKGG